MSFFLFLEVAGEVDIETPLFNNWAPTSPSASQGDCVYITVGVVSTTKIIKIKKTFYKNTITVNYLQWYCICKLAEHGLKVMFLDRPWVDT